MAISRQLDILTRLTAHLAGITPANGYDFDMTGRVFRGRTLYGDDDPLPMIAILELLQADADLQVAGLHNLDQAETWILLIQGFVKNQPDNPTDLAYQLKASIEHRLSRCIETSRDGDPIDPVAYMLGLYRKGVHGMQIGPGIVSPPREGISAYAFCYLPLGIDRTVNASDPFL